MVIVLSELPSDSSSLALAQPYFSGQALLAELLCHTNPTPLWERAIAWRVRRHALSTCLAAHCLLTGDQTKASTHPRSLMS